MFDTATDAQRWFAASTAPFPAFVGGFGSGKTHAGLMRALSLKSRCVGQDVAYYLPTYDLVRLIAAPRLQAALDHLGVRHTYNKQASHLVIPDWDGKIIFRTLETPERIVGYEVAHSIIDELDTLKPEQARLVWMKVIARNRQKAPMANSVAVVTTPEGFRFVYDRWVREPAPGYRLYRARTTDNAANLPEGYIENLRASYPSNLLAAYLDGEFVNLTSGGVYPAFDRAANATDAAPRPGEPLHVGMDFNVGKMAAVVFVLRGGEPHAAVELSGVLDTPAMIAALKARFPGHPILIYPDASGGARKSTDASVSDLALLRRAFTVMANPANPAVKDRVLAMNLMIGARRLRVNPDACPGLVAGLEKQAYDPKGEPDKTLGLDHLIDAAGYFIAHRFPVRAPSMARVAIGGV